MGGQKRKLLVGISLDFGGYEWRCRTDTRLSPILGTGVWRSLEACEEQVRRYGRRWDESQQSPWYCYKDGDVFVQGWYNDLASWRAKLEWIKAKDLGGIGVWILDGANDPPERREALRTFMKSHGVSTPIPIHSIRPRSTMMDAFGSV
jgi:spore germination protein YaaH